ncbi:MAG: hypothetical protein U9Q69_06240 [Nanoarchaeota archaeon]|nr:hypothetical protein [Nanoarchaeota archaeon]
MKKGSFEYILAEFGSLYKLSFSFCQGVCEQWLNKIGLFKYDTLEEAVEKSSTKKVNLVGHSLGALESMIYTIKNPEKVETCIPVGCPYGGTSMAYFGSIFSLLNIHLKSHNQILPNSKFINDFRKKFKERMPEIEKNNAKIINIWSPIDELIENNNASISHTLGLKSKCITEHSINTGHGYLFYCDFTQDLVRSLITESESNTILVHGLSINKNFFLPFIKTLNESQFKKTTAITYDYSRLLQI